MDQVTAMLDALAASPWAYVVMAGILIIDGFFPFVPGETAVVTLTALGAAGHGPNVWVVLLVAVAATMIGDGIAFAIGRTIGRSSLSGRFGWMRRPRVERAFQWAATGLVTRPTLFLMIAKFVPFARVAVTMTAGAGQLPLRRYLPISFAASTVYTAYHVTVAVIAGTAFAANPLIGAAVAIAVVIVLGVVFELIGLRPRRREAATPGEP